MICMAVLVNILQTGISYLSETGWVFHFSDTVLKVTGMTLNFGHRFCGAYGKGENNLLFPTFLTPLQARKTRKFSISQFVCVCGKGKFTPFQAGKT